MRSLRVLAKEAKSTHLRESSEEYQKFFKSVLDKFGVESPADLSDEEAVKFFNYIDDNWEAENETVSEALDQKQLQDLKRHSEKTIQGFNAEMKIIKKHLKEETDEDEIEGLKEELKFVQDSIHFYQVQLNMIEKQLK